MLCFLDLHFADVIADGNVKFFFEKPGEITGRQISMFSEFFYGDPAVNMAVNIVPALDDRV